MIDKIDTLGKFDTFGELNYTELYSQVIISDETTSTN